MNQKRENPFYRVLPFYEFTIVRLFFLLWNLGSQFLYLFFQGFNLCSQIIDGRIFLSRRLLNILLQLLRIQLQFVVF